MKTSRLAGGRRDHPTAGSEMAEGWGIELPCEARLRFSRPAVLQGRNPPKWRRTRESNSHAFTAPVFETGCRPTCCVLQDGARSGNRTRTRKNRILSPARLPSSAIRAKWWGQWDSNPQTAEFKAAWYTSSLHAPKLRFVPALPDGMLVGLGPEGITSLTELPGLPRGFRLLLSILQARSRQDHGLPTPLDIPVK